ncbi:uncharacterized protein ATNIH1004_004961 [Aspergillus tanneri]|uniref:Uncharacterized protein n=1 Tax=Aspergillus tanneri TaxID=1220188 RepID=A0A5M9MWS9_9EURO|nr:uncharacterized protein ATNIH1004_004961 [Aspergillus tanneri]KAA8649069.1 hypothetical protein ATNIH1004_004961 [Aspergillus tanneri]
MSNQDPQSPRHWHGSIGDRHEHHNVWVVGGPPQTYVGHRPSMSETANAMADRRDSASSARPATNNTGNSPPVAPDRRRSSGHGPSTLFESLTSQKRNSTDAARRASFHDQSQQGGFFSKWWEGYTRGK